MLGLFKTKHLAEHGMTAMVLGLLPNPRGGYSLTILVVAPFFFYLFFDDGGLLRHVLSHAKGHVELDDENLDHHLECAVAFHFLELFHEFDELVPVLTEKGKNRGFQFLHFPGCIGLFKLAYHFRWHDRTSLTERVALESQS